MLGASDVAFNEAAVCLACALTLPSAHALTHALGLVHRGRRLAANAYQAVAFAALAVGVVALAVVLSQALPAVAPPVLAPANVLVLLASAAALVAAPMLASPPPPPLLRQTPCKNDPGEQVDTGRHAAYFTCRALPTAALAVLVSSWSFGAVLLAADPRLSEACAASRGGGGGGGGPQWQDLLFCARVAAAEADGSPAVVQATAAAQATTALFLAGSLAAMSAGMLYRTTNILQRPHPQENRLWLGGVATSLALQVPRESDVIVK
jgi:hypothetical protein